jgi:hypothetical protein
VKCLRSVVPCITVFLVNVGLCMGAEQLSVSAARVNIRAVPDPQGEIVGNVSRGDVVSATGVRRDGWVEIKPPSAVSVWIYGELVRDGAVAAGSVRVRSGPGIGYRPVGTLSKGTEVETLGTKGDWLRIAPPSACTVWISDAFVSGGGTRVSQAPSTPVARPPVSALTAPAVATPPAVPAAAVKRQPVSTPTKPATQVATRTRVNAPATPSASDPRPPRSRVPAARRIVRSSSTDTVRKPPMPKRPLNSRITPPRDIVPVPPAFDEGLGASAGHGAASVYETQALPQALRKLHLVRSAPQGQSIEVSGVLQKTRFFLLGRPSRYRLTMREGDVGPLKTGCYVIGDSRRLAPDVGEPVSLIGKKYWVQGVKEPVVLVSDARN